MVEEVIYGIDIYSFVGIPFYGLLVFIIFDVITGVLRAGKDKVINSSINFDGLIHKMGMLVGVVFLTFIDIYLGTDGIIIKAGVYFLIFNEVISIVENLKQIGVDFKFIMKFFDKNKYKGGGK